MRSVFLVLIISAIALASSGFQTATEAEAAGMKKVLAPELGECDVCYDLMSEAINELLEATVNTGVLGSCDTLCGYLDNSIEANTCNILCDYVGYEAFLDALNATDPDPIYVCQLLDFCSEVANGTVTFDAIGVSPFNGTVGDTFNIYFNYSVIKPTGPGYVVLYVLDPTGGLIQEETFNDAQPVGQYDMAYSITATPSESEAFAAGPYKVLIAICEGDCSTRHPFGGVYAFDQTIFHIMSTNSTSTRA